MSSVVRPSVAASRSAVSASAVGRSRCSSKLVQHQDGEVGQERAGEGEPLALPAGQPGTVLADERVEPVGQAVGPVQQPSPRQRVAQVVLGRVLLRQQQVLAHRTVEEVRVLGAQPDQPPHVVPVHGVGVHPAERVGARTGVQEPQQHLRERRLAGTGGAHDGDPATLLHGEVDTGERVPVLSGMPRRQPLEHEGEG